MSKPTSYFEWENSFKSKKSSEKKLKNTKIRENSLGIPKADFKTYMKKWVSKNLESNEKEKEEECFMGLKKNECQSHKCYICRKSMMHNFLNLP